MAESKGEVPDTSPENPQDDGEISGKLPEEPKDKVMTEQPRDSVKRDEEDSMKADHLSDDSETNCIVCDPCEEDGKSLTAEGFCVDCNDFLCLDCFRFHKKLKPTKHHVLQDKTNMPQTKPTATGEKRNERHCLTHQGQTVLSYCTIHFSVVCKLCQLFDHRQCQKDGNLIDLDEIILDIDLLTDIQGQIADLGERMENNRTITTQAGDNILASYAHVVKEIKKIKESDLQMIKAISATCENMLLELVSMGEYLKSLSATEDKVQLFLELKKAQAVIKTFECELIQVKYDNKIFEYRFVKSDNQNRTFGKMGTLVKRSKEPGTINIQTEADTARCYITGITRLSGDKYVIADNTNYKVKLVDLTSKTVSLDLQLDMPPWDLTTIDKKKLALISCFNSRITIISISDTITVNTSIGGFQFWSYCTSITNINDNLVVYYRNPNEIQVQTLEGKVKHTISAKDENGCVRFDNVQYISQGIGTNTVFLTDGNRNKVSLMTLKGEILASFTHEYLNDPRGITCSRDGRIFVCSFGSHVIFEILSDLSQGHVVLGRENGIFQPQCIFFSDEKQQLLIGSKGTNTIQIF